MRDRVDGECAECGQSLDGTGFDSTHTCRNMDFCCHECLEAWYGDNVPQDEDFLSST